MLKSIVFSLATAFFALQATAQITETGTDTGTVGRQKVSAGDQSADTAGATATSPLKTAAPHIETIKEPPVKESGSTPSTPTEHAPNVSNSSLLAEGIAQKSTGTALACVGGVFLGGAILYTILFFTDQTTYGICIGSTSSGSSSYYYYEAYYLNPGIFAIPIGARA